MPKIPIPPNAGQRAREQADAYDSIFSSTPLELDNGDEPVMVPPHPNLRMLDDDRLEAYEELLFESESYDREPDLYIPEQKLSSGITLPSETRRGALMQPYRKDGQLLKPPFSVRMVMACLGDDEYKRLRAGGRSAGDVQRIWNKQSQTLADRQTFRSETNGSPSHLEPVPGGDSG